MSVFFYTPQGTFLHRLDPRIKIVLLVLFFAVMAFMHDIYYLSIIVSGILACFIAAGSAENIGKMAILFGMIGCATFILWVLFYSGPPGGASVYAGAMSLRFIDMLLAGLLFLSITSLEEFSAGLILLGVPYPAAFTVSLSFRLVIVFIAAGFTIVEAQKVRGNTVERGSVIKRIKAYAPLLVPLILNGIKKAETLTLALESKGFSPGNKIQIKDRYRMKISDWVALLLGFATIVLLSVLMIYY
jgi:energy-coupling factor transport system permease protein